VDPFSAASGLFSGVGEALGGFMEAGGLRTAAGYYGEAAAYSKEAGQVKDVMLRRQAYQTIGGAQADIAGGGLKVSGTAQGVLKSSAQQAGLARGIANINTQIQVKSDLAQQTEANAEANAAETGGIFGGISKILGGFI
jgi:hypothetical protein